jgi:hypothetical protein
VGNDGARGPPGIVYNVSDLISISQGINTNKNVYIVNTSVTLITITLPSATTNPILFVIVDFTGNAETNNITIAANGGDTIIGSGTYTLNKNYASVTLLSTLGLWLVI